MERSASAVARERLWITGLVGATGVVLSAAYGVAGIGLPCPLRALTGINCPLCGGTRMGSALLHLDLAAAWVYHPVALVGLALLGLLCVGWLVQWITDRTPRPLELTGQAMGRLVGPVPVPARWVVVGALAVGYALLRTFVWPIPA